jgi:hypothetical protein
VVDIYRFEGICCLLLQGTRVLKMEAALLSETLVSSRLHGIASQKTITFLVVMGLHVKYVGHSQFNIW